MTKDYAADGTVVHLFDKRQSSRAKLGENAGSLMDPPRPEPNFMKSSVRIQLVRNALSRSTSLL